MGFLSHYCLLLHFGGGGGGGRQPCVFLNPVGFKHAIVTVEFLACTVVAQL